MLQIQLTRQGFSDGKLRSKLSLQAPEASNNMGSEAHEGLTGEGSSRTDGAQPPDRVVAFFNAFDRMDRMVPLFDRMDRMVPVFDRMDRMVPLFGRVDLMVSAQTRHRKHVAHQLMYGLGAISVALVSSIVGTIPDLIAWAGNHTGPAVGVHGRVAVAQLVLGAAGALMAMVGAVHAVIHKVT